MKTGIELIAEERQRQVEKEGYSAEHDDKHDKAQLTKAAYCYLINEVANEAGYSPEETVSLKLTLQALGRWPWSENYWKPTTSIHDLVKAGALISAEIDRLQRKS